MIVSLEGTGKSDLLSLAYAFAALVFKSEQDREWLRRRFTMLSDDILEDSWAYQEMLAKGIEKGWKKGWRRHYEKLSWMWYKYGSQKSPNAPASVSTPLKMW